MLHKLQTLMHGIYFRYQILLLAKYSLHARKVPIPVHGTTIMHVVILYHHFWL